MARNFRADHRGIAEVLKGEKLRRLVDDTAEEIAANARPRSRGAPIVTHDYTTDRAAASVSAPTGLQARDGILTRAAAQAGLEIHGRPARGAEGGEQ